MFFKEHKSIFIKFLILFSIQYQIINCEDITVTVNVKKSQHIVSDQFISFNIDPKTFFKYVNFSSTNFNLITALSPAFIRLSGPSTKITTWYDSNKSTTKHLPDGLMPITPDQWIAFNEWAFNKNLTPIFALNDRHRINGVWDPRDSLAMMTLTDQMNYSCFWELGYECSNTSLSQYISDLTSLQHILDAFPSSKEYWGTVGSDFSGCFVKPSFEMIRNFLLSVENSLDAINWHVKKYLNETTMLSERDPIVKALMPTAKTKLPVMVTVPYAENVISFENGLQWALQLGDAAKYGFGVMFRQPTKMELFNESPVFWISYLHKNLLGRNVLDVKITSLNRTNTQVYSHCTKRQHRYIRRGALTIFAVNTQGSTLNIAVRASTNPVRSAEIQSYVLTSNGNIKDSQIFLNDEKLTYDSSSFRNNQFTLQPKIRRARANRAIMLYLPPYSIGYFVLPGARSPACIANEEDNELIVEEIIEDQNTGLHFDLIQSTITNNNNNNNNDNSPDLESDESKSEEKQFATEPAPVAQWDKLLYIRNKEKQQQDEFNATRQHIIERAKALEKHKMSVENELKKVEYKRKIADRARHMKQEQLEKQSLENLELTSDEVKLILIERAKKRKQLVDDDDDSTSEEMAIRRYRRKRFLPVDMLANFAEKSKKSEKDKDESAPIESSKQKSRQKRQIDDNRFSKRERKGLRDRVRRKESDDTFESKNADQPPPQAPPNAFYIKPIKIVPQEDVFVDILKPTERSRDYDYVDSEEEESEDDFAFGRLGGGGGEARRKCAKKTTGTVTGTTGRRDRPLGRRKNQNIDFLAIDDEVREWSLMDGDEDVFHAPHQFYENIQDITEWNGGLQMEDVRDDWKDYGELWEVDSLKDSIETEESDEDEEEYFYPDLMSDERNEPPPVPPHYQHQPYPQHQAHHQPYHNSEPYQHHHMEPNKNKMVENGDYNTLSSDMHGQETERREVRVWPDRYYYERNRINQTKEDKYNYYDNLMYKTTPAPPPMQYMPIKRKKNATVVPEPIPTTTTTPYPLYMTPKPKRKKSNQPKPEDIPQYMRFKRDISHIQKIPLKNVRSVPIVHPNNIQTITPKNYKQSLETKRYHRDRRDVTSVESSKLEESVELERKNRQAAEEDEDFSVVIEEKNAENNSPIFGETQTSDEVVQILSTIYETDDEITPTPNEEELRENSDEFYEPIEHFKYIIGRPFDLNNLKPLNEKRMVSFQKFLKNRLARQRKRNEKKNAVKPNESNNLPNLSNTDFTDPSIIISSYPTTEMPQVETIDAKNSQTLQENDPVISVIEKQQSDRKTKVDDTFRRKRQPNSLAEKVLKNLVKNKLNRNKRSFDDTYDLIRENEIFGNSEEEYRKGHKMNNIYKIKTQDGKKIVDLSNRKSTTSQFEKIPEIDIFEVNLLTTELPPMTINDDKSDSDDRWSGDSSSSSLSSSSELKSDEFYSFSREETSDGKRTENRENKDISMSSWDLSDEPEKRIPKKKIIIVTGQPVGNRFLGGNQFVGNFLKTVSSVLDRVHKRLSGYFTAL